MLGFHVPPPDAAVHSIYEIDERICYADVRDALESTEMAYVFDSQDAPPRIDRARLRLLPLVEVPDGFGRELAECRQLPSGADLQTGFRSGPLWTASAYAVAPDPKWAHLSCSTGV